MNDAQALPLGLKMAVLKNFDAIEKFACLSDFQREAFISGASEINSKEGMEDYVSRFLNV